VGHRGLFSGITRELSRPERERIIAEYYRPYRAAVETALAESIRRRRRVLHVSVHSFTPVLNGATRNADIGLLYDPARPAERALAAHWKQALAARLALRVRRNYPYRGTADGFTSWLRKRFPDPAYAGIEFELNQRLLPLPRRLAEEIAAALAESVRHV
jgi:predicted N-formylglutamate amidohydrolase